MLVLSVGLVTGSVIATRPLFNLKFFKNKPLSMQFAPSYKSGNASFNFNYQFKVYILLIWRPPKSVCSPIISGG